MSVEPLTKAQVKLLPVIVDAGIKSRRTERFVQMVRAVGGYVAFGAGLGLLLLLRHNIVGIDEALKPFGHVVNEILDHIGSALLVSATVICLYEWGAEAKHSADLAGKLADVLERHIDTILEASSRESLVNALRQIVGTHADVFAIHLRQFSDALRDLGGNDWAAPAYTEFVRWNLEKLSAHASGLANLSVSIRADRNARTEYRLVLPSPSDIADVMLERTTTAMGTGTYYAISDAYTWTKLTHFRRAQQAALVSGDLKIHRIFILGKPSDADIGAADVTRLVYEHYADAKKSNGAYQMKLMDQEEYERLATAKLSSTHHFGIFSPDDNTRPPLIFHVVEPRLSAYRLAGAAEADDVAAEFKLLWSRLPELREVAGADGASTKLSGADLIRDHLLAYRVKQLSFKGLYRGVSRLETWRERALEQFHAAAREATVRHSVVMRRIFVAADAAEARRDDVIELLMLHAVASAQSGDGTYEWKICLREDLPLPMRDDVPFGLFSDEGVNDGQMVREVAMGDDPFIFDTRSSTFGWLASAFDSYWNDIGRDKSIRDALGDQADKVIQLLPPERERA